MMIGLLGLLVGVIGLFLQACAMKKDDKHKKPPKK